VSETDLDFAASFIMFHCLWCDQGMAHVLEVRGPDFQPAALAVFDFGVELLTKSGVLRAEQAAPAVEKLMHLLSTLPEPRIEYFIISHQDTDHWSLVTYFLEAVEAARMPLTIGKVIYGGQGWKEDALAQMTDLGAFTANPTTDVVRHTKVYSDFLQEPASILGRIGDVYIQTLVVNAPTPVHKTGALWLNGTSAVISVEFHGQHFILPGDSTWETLQYANTIISWWQTSPLIPTELMSVPHHGALKTLVDKAGGDARAFEIVREFVDNCQANSTVASAGSANRNRHPHRRVIEAFSTHVGEGGFFTPLVNEHWFVAYDETARAWQYSPPTRRNIYTTVLSIDTNPIWVANWTFILDAGKERVTTFEAFTGATRATINTEPMDTEEEFWWAEQEDDDPFDEFTAKAHRELPPHLLAVLSEGVKLYSYQLPGQPEVIRPLNRRTGQKKLPPVKRVRARRRPAGPGS